MTRKDYELIARAISAARVGQSPEGSEALDDLVEILAAELADGNPRFDDKKFREATR